MPHSPPPPLHWNSHFFVHSQLVHRSSIAIMPQILRNYRVTGVMSLKRLLNSWMCAAVFRFSFFFFHDSLYSNHMTQKAVTELFLDTETLRRASALRLPWHFSQLSPCLFSSFPSHPSAFPSDGLAAFRAFLRTEFSEENLEFWLACEEYKKIKSQSKMASKAKKIFAEYIAIQSCKEVSANKRSL